MHSLLSLTALLTLSTSILSGVEAVPRSLRIRRDGVAAPYLSSLPSAPYGSQASAPSATPGGPYRLTPGPYSNSTDSPSSNSTAWQSSQPSQPALLPAVHWNYDVSDIRNLAPVDSCNLYYSANGVSGVSASSSIYRNTDALL